MMRKREPDFNNLLQVLKRAKPGRPTLFEFFLNAPLYRRFAGIPAGTKMDVDTIEEQRARFHLYLDAFGAAGYDYAVTPNHFFPTNFPAKAKAHEKTLSLNDGGTISDWASFESYP